MSASVRDYTILGVTQARGSTGSGGGGVVSGGAIALETSQHDIEGLEHTNRTGVLLAGNVISPTQLVADTDDWSPTGLSTTDVIRASMDATRDLTGIVAVLAASGAGKAVALANVGTVDMVLTHEDASSAAANRFLCPNDEDLTLKPDAWVLLWYDATSTRWRAGGTGASSGEGTQGPPGVPGRDGEDGADSYIPGPQGKPGATDSYFNHGNCGATEDFSFALYTFHRAVLDANCTFTFSGAPAAGVVGFLTMLLVQDGTGSRTVTWPGSVAWISGVAPTLQTVAGSADLITFVTYDGGSTYIGSYARPGPTGAPGSPGATGGVGVPGPAGPSGPWMHYGEERDEIDIAILATGGGPASASGSSAFSVSEEDGNPVDAAATGLVFPNDTVTMVGHVAHVRQVPYGFVGAKVTRGAAQTINDSAQTEILWTAEAFDTDSFHDLVTATGRITIALGGKYLIQAAIEWAANSSGVRYIDIQKNGTTVVADTRSATASLTVRQSVDVMLDLVAGDYLQVTVYQNRGGTLDVAASNGMPWFSAVKLDAGRVGSGVGCRAYQGVAQTISNNTWTALTFDTESFDTDGLHSVASNTSRFTVPPGMAGKYLVSGAALWATNGSGSRYTALAKNGSRVINVNLPGGNVGGAFLNTGVGLPISDVFDLVAGDYIELHAYQDSGGNLNTFAGSYLSIMRLDSNASGVLASAKGVRTSGIIQTTSTAWIDADATNLKKTITTGARRCLVVFSGVGGPPGAGDGPALDVEIDGVRVGDSTYGLTYTYAVLADTGSKNLSFAYVTDVLSAGSHIFALKLRSIAGGNVTLHGGGGQPVAQFSVQELPDSGALATGSGLSVSKIVRGSVTSAGAVSKGTGFTAAKPSTGHYTVTFATAFASAPIVVVTGRSTGGTSDRTFLLDAVNPPTTTDFKVQSLTSSGGAYSDAEFDFIAMSAD